MCSGLTKTIASCDEFLKQRQSFTRHVLSLCIDNIPNYNSRVFSIVVDSLGEVEVLDVLAVQWAGEQRSSASSCAVDKDQ